VASASEEREVPTGLRRQSAGCVSLADVPEADDASVERASVGRLPGGGQDDLRHRPPDAVGPDVKPSADACIQTMIRFMAVPLRC
jgi:hypothetical protein